jgi:hypothetical protein
MTDRTPSADTRKPRADHRHRSCNERGQSHGRASRIPRTCGILVRRRPARGGPVPRPRLGTSRGSPVLPGRGGNPRVYGADIRRLRSLAGPGTGGAIFHYIFRLREGSNSHARTERDPIGEEAREIGAGNRLGTALKAASGGPRHVAARPVAAFGFLQRPQGRSFPNARETRRCHRRRGR